MKNSTTFPLQEINLLLADDDSDDCLFFKEAIEEFPVPTKLTTVENGQQLLNFLGKLEKLPDALFLDLNMPRINGIECLYEIKRTPRLKSMPVIILSTSIEKNIVNLLYRNGAIFYIRKPAEFDKLRKIIHYSLNLIAQKHFSRPSKENFFLNNIPI